ncbi:EscU/YscU/HrcU family type III secretion system export apparatus switch protein [Pararhodobacter oceanensis]|uniref:Flagellar biosynthesis protein FlhB n=1 Tax=Pararhodobacter oceanensis TaxID=2172121 RepID=A0A2T8HXZ3_9RHOB|nr:flagellar type III secretion system protein FlhB [Pararhodobacter oceanensis]PVH30293.1 flagellar biosynthesis protein FlhB [Pararhodobacter oceanensis]
MSGQDDDTERPYEATPRKLDEARKRGEIPKTSDLTAAAAAVGLLALTLLPGGWTPVKLGEIGQGLLARADMVGPALLGGGTSTGGTILAQIGLAMAPIALLPGALALILLFALRGLVFAPQKLEPKLSRISPLSNAKNKFGPTGLMEFAKSTVKLIIYGMILWAFLAARMPELLAAQAQSSGPVAALLLRMMAEFLAIVVLVMIVIGTLDHFWQVYDHNRRQRMSHQELREDHKQAEGDPHMKQQRRARAQEIATNKMLTDVPQAAVVIVNPTHYAVALKWAPGSAQAPVCVAKGADEIAARIREVAQEATVPIHSDPPTARALFATTEIGAEISPDHYQAVAAAIRFAEAMRQRARKRHGGSGNGGSGNNGPMPGGPGAPR